MKFDLLIKCQFLGGAAFFLIHIETQAQSQENFAGRMFHYFARLTANHALPVYPIALLTYDAPERPEPDRFEVRFPDLAVLTFRFRAIQLNQLSWREFLRRPNPVAAALMARMKIAPEDRPRVQLECLRMLVTLKLNPARQALIREFMNAYLRLNAAERRVYDTELKHLEPAAREAIMKIIDQWEERGEARGRTEAMLDILVRQIQRRFDMIPADLRERLAALSTGKLEQLADLVLEVPSLSDLEAWLSENTDRSI